MGRWVGIMVWAGRRAERVVGRSMESDIVREQGSVFVEEKEGRGK